MATQPQPSADLSALLDTVRLDAELGRRSFREYVGMAWPHVESAPFVPNWHIDAMAEHLQAVTAGQIQDLLINIPPGCSKSLMTCVFWPTWEWAREAKTRFLFASYDQHLSTRDSVKSRSLIDTSWYRARWPHVRFKSDQNEKTYYETSAGGWRLSTSIGGHGTGEHPDRTVVDDPHNVRKAESDKDRETVIQWWDLTISLRGMARNARRVVIMQRLHENDLSGYILAKEEGWTHICLPMRYEPKRMVATPLRWSDPRTNDGELLTPQQFPEAKVQKMEKRLGAYGSAGQLQQRPSPAGGGKVKREWWRYYKDLPERFDEIVQSWDLTFDKKAKSHFVSGQVWGRIGARILLLDRDHRRMNAPDQVRAILNMSAKWPLATAKLIENKANGPAVIAMLNDKVQGIIPIPASESKEARVDAISPLIEAGNVYLPALSIGESVILEPWVEEFIEEWTQFPNGAFDDDVDAGSQALNRLRAAVEAVWDTLPVSITKTTAAQHAEERVPATARKRADSEPQAPVMISGRRRGRIGW